jgi:catechol 2,3-dioxygenase-like lactoylglutathione lyase family enzyme
MLREHPIHATIPATDLERARGFYADKLGLTPTREDPAGLGYETPGGAWFRLYRTPYAGTAQHTIAGWEVEDLEAEVAERKAGGVAFPGVSRWAAPDGGRHCRHPGRPSGLVQRQRGQHPGPGPDKLRQPALPDVGEDAELGQHSQPVGGAPELRHPAVGDPQDGDRFALEVPPGWRRESR